MPEQPGKHTSLRIPPPLLDKIERLRKRIEKKAGLPISPHRLLVRLVEIGYDGYAKMVEREERKH